MSKTPLFLFVAFLIVLLSYSCRKDVLIDDSSAKLEFSTDSILFDTVFSAIGSATQNFRVYNRHNKTIKISSIKLGGGQASNFRINVDGVPGVSFTDVEILPKDSIFIFVEVTVDPDSQATPYIVTDSVIFITNNNVQKVDLAAWGQNAYFHYNDTGQPFNIYDFDCYSCFPVDCNTSWPVDKPHIVFGYAVIDSNCTLTIPAGAKIYFYNNSGMLAYKAATLKVEGTIADPVNFEGFRREQHYADVPGQWDRIWLAPGSRDNEISNARIKNGNVGLHVDTVGSGNPTLTLKNTIISNMATIGVLAQGAKIDAENSVISNCGARMLALTLGGEYSFTHCSFGNFWSHSIRQTPSILLNNYYVDVNNQIQLRDLILADFGNSIIWGSENEELEFVFNAQAQSNYFFDNCIIRSGHTGNMVNVIKQDPKFSDDSTLELGEGSPAINSGAINIAAGVPLDIKGNDRTATPDRGAWEKQ